MTFSIIAKSSRVFGVAVASGSISVGRRVPHLKPGIGAVATQAYTSVTYGIRGLQLMEKRFLPREALDSILKDDAGKELRQVAMMDTKGNIAVHTGIKVPESRGEAIGKNYVAIGNLLAGRQVVERMADGFEQSSDGLVWRMIDALKAARESGGDMRGERSAALIIADSENVRIRIEIDEHKDPINGLMRRLARKIEESHPMT